MRKILIITVLILLVACISAIEEKTERSPTVPRQCFDLPEMRLDFHPEEGYTRKFSVDQNTITLSDYKIGAGAPAQQYSYNFFTGNVTKYNYPGGAVRGGYRTIYKPETQGFIRNLDYIKGHVKNYIIVNGKEDQYSENLTIILNCLDKVYKDPQ
ncbi:hypothetical protein KY310_02875 [Candidatus Woesearchaeota archaeon]|nr:hypothetical protein [Candidatus Woesearchaeota archaeon]